LLPEFALPYLHSSVVAISLFLMVRLLNGRSLREASAFEASMPYQRGQFWVRRFQAQAQALCAALASLTPVVTAPDFVQRAVEMLKAAGWIRAHRFLFSQLRMHLLGWPRSLIPDGRRRNLSSVVSSCG
jgi:hypothetical protein